MIAGTITPVTPVGVGVGATAGGSFPADKLELAKRVALKLTSSKNLGADSKAQMTAEAVMKGGLMSITPKVTGTFILYISLPEFVQSNKFSCFIFHSQECCRTISS